MNNEEKILEMLENLTGKVDTLSGRVDQIQADQKEMKTDISDLKLSQSTMQTTLTRVAVTQENIVLKGLDALAEGQDLTHQRLKDLAGKDELAELREEVRLLRSVVAQHSKDIEALKAAQ